MCILHLEKAIAVTNYTIWIVDSDMKFVISIMAEIR